MIEYILIKVNLTEPTAANYDSLHNLIMRKYQAYYLTENVFGLLELGEYYRLALGDISEDEICLELKQLIEPLDGNPSIKVIQTQSSKWEESWEAIRA